MSASRGKFLAWPTFIWTSPVSERHLVTSFFGELWDRVHNVPDDAWHWFNTLNREEWLVVLFVTCACGFLGMLGFRSNRL
jgi:hypothetical protein